MFGSAVNGYTILKPEVGVLGSGGLANIGLEVPIGHCYTMAKDLKDERDGYER